MSAAPSFIGDFAAPPEAAGYFHEKLGFETDCADVHAAIAYGEGFTLLDVRSPEAFAAGHIPGSVNLPHGQIDAATLRRISDDGPFVAYCWGPHCNGADRAALAISTLGRRVKVMIGGVHGWELEGYALTEPPT